MSELKLNIVNENTGENVLRAVVLAVLSEMGVTGVSQAEIQNAVSSYLSNHPIEGITENEVTQIVTDYISNYPTGVDTEEVNALIADYMSNHPTDTLTESEVNNIISDYMEEHPTEGVSEEQIAQSVSDYIENHPISGGEKGDTGATPNITVNASVDNTSGTPTVNVSKSGTAENPVISFAFSGLKGADGSGEGDYVTHTELADALANIGSSDEPTTNTETFTGYTEGKSIKWETVSVRGDLTKLVIYDSTYALGTTDFIDLTNAIDVEISAFACQVENAITFVLYDENKNPIYAGDAGYEQVEINTTTKFIPNYHVSNLHDASYIRVVFWKNAVITWEHPFVKVTYSTSGESGQTGEIQTVRFGVPINTAHTGSGETITYNDYGILFLPKTYKSLGKKTRLIIACHGSGTVINSAFNIDSKDYIKTFVNMGYAVLDVNGGVADGRHFGAEFALSSYIKAYRKVIKQYNLYPEVFVFGASMGGLCSFGLVQSGSVPVIAQAAVCPVVDLLRQAWMNPWWSDNGNYGRQRERIAEYYNFDNYSNYTSGTSQLATAADMQYFVANYMKTMGFNPIIDKSPNGASVITDATSGYEPLYANLVKMHNVPLIVCHAQNDNTVAYEFSEYLVNAIKRGGGIAHLKSYLTGDHSPNLGGEVTLKGVDGVSFNSYNSLSVCVEWFKRWE